MADNKTDTGAADTLLGSVSNKYFRYSNGFNLFSLAVSMML